MSEPCVVIFHQNTWQNRLFTYFSATRPGFFSASVLVVIAALALAWHLTGTLKIDLAFLTVLAIMCFHAGANVLNDYYDLPSDNANQQRIYPFSGGSRFIQNQVLSRTETFRLGATLLAIGTALGVWMIALSSLDLLWFGLLGVLLAVFYSAPPCLACRGLGDVTIAITFGVLPVTGTVWLQVDAIPVEAWWLGVIVGIFTAAILWINSIPDIEADRRAAKYTLPVRLGAKRAPYGLAILLLAGFAMLAYAPLPSGMRWALLAMLPAFLALRNALHGRLLPAIMQVLLTHALVCILLTIGALLS